MFLYPFFSQAECWKELEEKDQPENKEGLFSLCSAEDELGIIIFHLFISLLFSPLILWSFVALPLQKLLKFPFFLLNPEFYHKIPRKVLINFL